MSYWIFRTTENTCLAVEENTLADSGIHDNLGELIFDDPMPLLIAQMCISRHGGRIIGRGSSRPLFHLNRSLYA